MALDEDVAGLKKLKDGWDGPRKVVVETVPDPDHEGQMIDRYGEAPGTALKPADGAVAALETFLSSGSVDAVADGTVSWTGRAGQWGVQIVFHGDGGATVYYGPLP